VTALKILIISFEFPPYGAIGAVRVGKTAKYLRQFGHDVHVVCAGDRPLDTPHVVELEPQRIHYTSWRRADSLLKFAVRSLRSRTGAPDGQVLGRTTPSGPRRAGRATKIARLYQNLVYLPDAEIGWALPAMRECRTLQKSFRPDIILASGRPWTGLLVARLVARHFRIPLVCELRDLWADDMYAIERPNWREKIDQIIERWVLRRAHALITVSEPLASVLQQKYNVPTVVALNGYDPDDQDIETRVTPTDELRLVYTGSLFEQRDLRPLIRAIAVLRGEQVACRLDVAGHVGPPTYLNELQELCDALHVDDRVRFLGQLPRTKALELQAHADVLVLVTWNDPREHGVYTGKLFEYVGSKRPILLVGLTTGVAAELLRSRGLGEAGGDELTLASLLRTWHDEKRVNGRLQAPPPEARIGLTREEQTRVIEALLLKTGQQS